MSFIRIPFTVRLSIAFVKILSIRVAVYLVIRVGLVIRGHRPGLYIMSIKCFVRRCLSCFRMSILKSAHKKFVLLWGLFSKMRSTFSQG